MSQAVKPTKPGPGLRLHLRLTGAPVLHVGEQVLALDGLAAVLAARLALEGPQPRATLAAQLWPDADEARARANLRQRLLRLKTQAGTDWLVGDAVLALAPGLKVEPVDDPDAGDLLHGVRLGDNESLADWLDAQRHRQRLQRVARLAAAVQEAEAEQRLADAIAGVQRQLAIEPLAEAHHRNLIRLHYLDQDGARARAAFNHLVDLLKREFGAAPSAETQALMRLVSQVPQVSTVLQTPPAGAAQPLRPARERFTALQRPPLLVGRERERASLAQALHHGQAVLLLGEAGMGKSRLLAETLLDPARHTVVKAHAGDTGVPYATLARLLRRVLEQHRLRPQAGSLERLLPELAPASASAPVVVLPVGGERLLLQTAVEQLLAEAGLQAVAVDDLHFADDASLEMLTSLVASMTPSGPDDGPTGLAWVFTQRPGEGSAAAAALRDALEEAQRLQVVELAPLDESQLARLLQSLDLVALQGADIVPRLLRHTGGNPLFVLETLKQMLLPGSAVAALPQPASVGALIDRRLKRLSDDALALARAAAIAGPDFSPELAESVLGRKALALADAWAELEGAQVIRDNAFAHDLVLDAALRSIPRAIGVHLHAAVARHLQDHGGQPARVAGHWLAAQAEARALPWLLRAADQARDTMRRREEAAFVETAADIASRHALSDAPAAHALFVRAYLAREYVEGVAAGLPLLDRALAQARGDADRARVLSLRASGRIKSFELDGAVTDAQAALALAVQAGDDEIIADTMSNLAAALSILGRNDEAAAVQARHWPAVERMADPKPSYFGERGLVLDNLGRPHEARVFHQQAVERSRRRGEHGETVVACHNMAVSCIDTGELLAAEQLLMDGESLRLAHDDMHGAIAVGWNLQANVWRDLGRYRDALQACDRMLDAATDQLPVREPMDRLHRAWLWYWLGQPARALNDLRGDDGYPQLPAWVPARALQLRARLARSRGQPGAGLLQRAAALLSPTSLRTMRESILLDQALAAGAVALPTARALRAAAEADRLYGLRWAAEWACARLALAAGEVPAAMAHARACMDKPADQVPLDLAAGTWWHGLWTLWRALGERDRADAARAEGVAWIHRTLQRELVPEFQPAFRDAVPAHRELLAG